MDFEFSSDLPINSAEEDRLARASFALAIAKAIIKWRQKSSLVIALNGDWGSGKSSIKNMVVASLGDRTVGREGPSE